jgi:predicted ATPase/DNA-binding XRE family transcriptional regulator
MAVTSPAEPSPFGALLRRYRLAAGLSQEALAEKARMSSVGVGALERGTRRAPYRETAQLLADALGLSGEARAAFMAAAKRKTGRPRAAPEPVPAGAGEGGKLPLRLTSFVGREREVEDIRQAMQRSRLVTVTGFGGIGKTSVALHVASLAREEWEQRVWFAPLAALADGALVPGAIASALQVRLPANGDPVFALCEALRERRALLVLDNCEHVVADVAAVAGAILRACPGIALLASSREPLGIAGEAAYRLPALEVPPGDERLSPEAALRFAAVALFVDRATSAEASFALDAHNVADVAAICRRLEGIALAIELAAARTRALAPAEIAARLDERFALLTGNRRDAQAQHRTLRATLDWSYGLLDASERAVLRRSAVFAGGFTLEAMTALAADLGLDAAATLDVVQSLIDKSLVDADLSVRPVRYALLDSTRAYALERLVAEGERAAAAARHLRYYRQAFERADAVHEATLGDGEIAALAPELDNVRVALEWSLSGGDLDEGAALASASGRLWFVLGLMHERIAQLEAFLAACGEERPAASARLWTSLTYIAGDSLRAARAADAADAAVAAARRADDETTLHDALLALAFVAARRHDNAAAAGAFREAQALLGQTRTPRRQMRLLSVRGLLAAQREDPGDAAAAHEEALELAQRVGNAHWRMVAMLNLAEVEHQRGHTARAIALAREAAPEAAKRLAPNAFVHLLNNLAGYYAAIGDLEGARVSARDALARLALSDPQSGLISIALEHLALVLALDGDYARAARLQGFCESAYAAAGFVRQFTERSSNERLAAILEAHFEARDLAELRAAGAALDAQRAVEEATR